MDTKQAAEGMETVERLKNVAIILNVIFEKGWPDEQVAAVTRLIYRANTRGIEERELTETLKGQILELHSAYLEAGGAEGDFENAVVATRCAFLSLGDSEIYFEDDEDDDEEDEDDEGEDDTIDQLADAVREVREELKKPHDEDSAKRLCDKLDSVAERIGNIGDNLAMRVALLEREEDSTTH